MKMPASEEFSSFSSWETFQRDSDASTTDSGPADVSRIQFRARLEVSQVRLSRPPLKHCQDSPRHSGTVKTVQGTLCFHQRFRS